jgi:hypothetical protein
MTRRQALLKSKDLLNTQLNLPALPTFSPRYQESKLYAALSMELKSINMEPVVNFRNPYALRVLTIHSEMPILCQQLVRSVAGLLPTMLRLRCRWQFQCPPTCWHPA